MDFYLYLNTQKFILFETRIKKLHVFEKKKNDAALFQNCLHVIQSINQKGLVLDKSSTALTTFNTIGATTLNFIADQRFDKQLIHNTSSD